MKLEEKPIPDTHSVYLAQFDIQTLQRKDFSFSGQFAKKNFLTNI
jgi:hypothetical protein